MFCKKKEQPPPAPEPNQENLFRGFEFRNSVKDLPPPETGRLQPRIYRLNELDHVKSERWWW